MEWIEPLLDVDTGEALGLFAALEWVHKLQFNNVNFELDSKHGVDHFHSKHSNVSNFDAIISNYRHAFSLIYAFSTSN
ncbi:hypothetical protein MTR_5g069700 [Medicago truncatula]|uniref:RNase H type-1 domain-containing protein n=1 Tax=Medicago truncatula TaxID=3880 RepID=G7KE44_MEDTR|nr:hypothetical protein MTR_5g069700 [Medicago truncatula]